MLAFLWSVIQVSNSLILLALIGLLLAWFGKRRSGLALTSIGLIGFIVWSVSPLGTFMISTLEERFPQPGKLPDNIAGIIVLGGSIEPIISAVWGQPGLNDRVERLTEGVALAHQNPDLPLAFTGGVVFGMGGVPSEAAIARYFFKQMNVTNPLILEDRAANTHENADFLAPLLPKDRTGPWVLVTSAYHMPRAVGTFRAAGVNIIPYPVDYKWVPGWSGWSYEFAEGAAFADFAMREWLALFVYHQRGWIAQTFPGP